MIYAIGDIHGQDAMLRAMLDVLADVPLENDDILIFIGDYIDRGPDSRGVLETLLALQKSQGNVVFLRGNHEQLMLDARHGPLPEPDFEHHVIRHSEPMQLWL